MGELGVTFLPWPFCNSFQPSDSSSWLASQDSRKKENIYLISKIPSYQNKAYFEKAESKLLQILSY